MGQPGRIKTRIVSEKPCFKTAREIMEMILACIGQGADTLQTVSILAEEYLAKRRASILVRIEDEIDKVVKDQAQRDVLKNRIIEILTAEDKKDATQSGHATGKILQFPSGRRG